MSDGTATSESMRTAEGAAVGESAARVGRRRAGIEGREEAGVRYLSLDRPKGNVIDTALCGALLEHLSRAADDSTCKLLVLGATGPNFSFGASVEEHLPDRAAGMLEALGRVVAALVAFPYPTLAAIRGRCLGGGLELGLACDLMVVEEGAVLGAPEIRLGVFAPAATALLQTSVPRAVAAEILLTGRDFGADEALRWGIANRVAPAGGLDGAVEEFADEHFRPRSAASLRQAVRGFRGLDGPHSRARLQPELHRLERLYLRELLELHDGTEGIRAFLEKRPPRWRDR